MSDVAGKWDCVVKSPMGEQNMTLTVIPGTDGTFTGSNAGTLGSLDVTDGRIEGNTLTWKMEMKIPMPMTLDCDATVDGDSLTGGVKAGPFGTSPMTGKRVA